MSDIQEAKDLNKRAALIRRDIRASEDDIQELLNELYLINKKLSYLKTINDFEEENLVDE